MVSQHSVFRNQWKVIKVTAGARWRIHVSPLSDMANMTLDNLTILLLFLVRKMFSNLTNMHVLLTIGKAC